MTTFALPEDDEETQPREIENAERRTNEAMFRAIADTLHTAIWVFDNNYHTLYTNAALTKLLGYPSADLVGKGLEEVLFENDEISRLHLDDHLERQKPFEVALRHINGQSVWCKFCLRHLQDIGVLAELEDVTPQNEDNTQPLTIDKYYLKIFAQFPKSGVMIFDKDLRFHSVYGNFYRQGLTPADIEGRIISEVYPEDFAAELAIPMRRALAGEIVVMEKPFRDRFHWMIFAPQQQTDGQITHAMVLIQNITERKLAEITLRESEMFYRGIFETFFDGLIVSVDGVIVDVNTALETMTGYTYGELVGENVDILVPPEWRGVIQERVKNQVTTYLQGATLRKDGIVVPVDSQSVIIPYKGETARLTALRDITQRFEAQRIQLELEKANELRQHKDFFLSVVSHEFRTPLAVIRSSTDILERHYQKLTPEKRQTHFERVFSQIDKLSDMVGDVLLLSRSEMQGIEFLPQQCDIDLFCQDLLANLARAYPKTRVEYITQLSQKSFYIDPYLLEHILWNLLGNGAKYSPTDDGQVSLHLTQIDHALRIEVKDNGIGIPAHDIEHIFDPFHRASNVGAIVGTGMGLAIVKRFVELHGGIIECSSEVGKGTTFSITISVGGEGQNANSGD